jgi:predicted RND superfamily exporter protein
MQKTEQIVNEINQITDNWELPNNGRVSRITGQDAINVAVNNKLFDEQSRSMIIALILVLAALIVIFNSSMYGFLTLIPVCFVLMWEPGFLVGTSTALSPVTITIASIMIGIGIDYGIHITHRFREELSRGLSKIEATKTAIEKTGLSLLEAAMTTVFGMASIYFIGISALSEFVTVIIFMTSMSFIAAALLLPMFYDNRFIK